MVPWNNVYTVLAVLYVQLWALHTEINPFKYHPISPWQNDTANFHFYLTEGWKQEPNVPNNPTEQNKVIQINQPKSNLALLERIPVCTSALKLRTLAHWLIVWHAVYSYFYWTWCFHSESHNPGTNYQTVDYQASCQLSWEQKEFSNLMWQSSDNFFVILISDPRHDSFTSWNRATIQDRASNMQFIFLFKLQFIPHPLVYCIHHSQYHRKHWALCIIIFIHLCSVFHASSDVFALLLL